MIEATYLVLGKAMGNITNKGEIIRLKAPSSTLHSGQPPVEPPLSEFVPLCLPGEIEELDRRLREFSNKGESLLILQFENFFSSGLDFEYICAFMLCANALAMWKTGGAVTRLLVLSGDITMQSSERMSAFANQFRSLMQGGFARIDNASVWMNILSITQDIEPLDLRDFRRAIRVFSAARVSPDSMSSLKNAEWYFGFKAPRAEAESVGHFRFESTGSHSVRISNSAISKGIDFEDRFNSGQCEVLSSPSGFCYQLGIDLTGVKEPLSGADAARYLDVFSSLIGISVK